MSSILDALRKLEEEKSQHQAAQETPLPIEPPTREPAPRRSRVRAGKRKAQDRNRKLWIAVPLTVFCVGVLLAAVAGGFGGQPGDSDTVAMANAPTIDDADTARLPDRDPKLDSIEASLRDVAETPLQEMTQPAPDQNLTASIQAETFPEIETQPTDANTPEPRPEPTPIESPPIQMDVKPIPIETAAEPEPAPVEEPPADLPPPPVKREPIETAQAPEPTFEPEPEPEPIAPPQQTEPSERYKEMMATTESAFGSPSTAKESEPAVEEDIRRYDIMTRTVRAQLGIPELDINMLMLPNDVNPDPAALINYNKVYVGETIPDTQGRASLVGVDIRGIAVEVDGRRYYYPK